MTVAPRPRLSRWSRLSDYAIYLGIGGLFLALFLRPGSGPKEGSRAQNFRVPLANGQGTLALDDYKGKPVLLEVFASWCGACQSSAATVNAVHEAAKERGVQVLAVSLDEQASSAKRASETWPIRYPVGVDDGTVARAYAVSLLPTFILIGHDGVVRRVASGSPSESKLKGWFAEL